MTPNATAATDKKQALKNLAQQLIDLRADVEKLQDEIDAQKDTYKSRLQTLNIKTSDLTANIQRQELQIRQLQENIRTVRQKLTERFSNDGGLSDMLDRSFTELRTYIKSSLPFKQEERLTALQKLADKFADDAQSPYQTANRLWAFIEDEMRLHRDVGIYKQVLTVNGTEQLTEIAKVGMITFYFKTPDRHTGQMHRQNGEWQLSRLTDSAAVQTVDTLFNSLKKQLRVGRFELPHLVESATRKAAH
jgi:seryl-tRNA synthetase